MDLIFSDPAEHLKIVSFQAVFFFMKQKKGRIKLLHDAALSIQQKSDQCTTSTGQEA